MDPNTMVPPTISKKITPVCFSVKGEAIYKSFCGILTVMYLIRRDIYHIIARFHYFACITEDKRICVNCPDASQITGHDGTRKAMP